MNEVERLYREFIAEHKRGGEANPRAFLDQLEDDLDRLELAALIRHYLERAPGRRWDPEAYAESKAARVADSILAEWELAGGRAEATVGWRELLPELRERARIMRREVVARLAESLGVPDKEAKVGAYYHRMELEELPVDGVSDRVLEALARILGTSAETLRAAGRVRSGRDQPGAGVAFARKATPSPDFSVTPAAPSAAEAAGRAEAERDLVDELFTGGPEAGN
ncbi:MAG TPA: hypothetical protein VIL04_14380 [Solirubrobacterales bacterium]|jgi:hypothetical protein